MIKQLKGSDGNRLYSWDLYPGKYTLGRSPDCEFSILNSTVSRKHVEFEVTNDHRYFITDLGSHNGTTVNQMPVTDKVEINGKDRICFGEAEFKIGSGENGSINISPSITTRLADHDPEKSVFLSIKEVLKPLPAKVIELPNVLPTLFEMAKTLVLPEPKEVMLKRSLELISKVIPAERLAILTTEDNKDKNSDEVIIAASLNTSEKELGNLILSKTIINDILTNKNAILIGNPMDDPHFANQQSIIMSEMKSALAVPLFDEGEVLGILYVDTTNPLHRYNNDYLKLLGAFGNIIASRLVNYALLNIRADRQLIEAELKRASSIQKKLLDMPQAEIPGYKICALQEQCRSVGGDMFDICLSLEGHLIFMVADVSGKGMGAALLMSNILASFRILFNNKKFELSEAVKQVSNQLYIHSAQEDFATLFMGVIDPKSNELTFVNAGHNPPILMRQNKTIEYLDPSGIMIGAFPLMEWTETKVNLNVGDLVVVYSDGVTEAEGPECQYGEEKLEQFIKNNLDIDPDKVASTLMQDIKTFAGSSPQSDDITMLIVKRNE